jgi:predicted DNA-binding transcriptional regulator YafY
MGDTAGRLLRLLSLLQSRPGWGGPELAERLGVTERTVRRDVARLRELGYPVDGATGPAGGYELGAGGALPPLLLDDDEAVAVAVGLRTAAGSSIAGLEDAAVAALAKLEQVLPVRLRERVTAVHTTTERLPGARGPQVDPDVLVALAQACRQLERLRFAYRSAAQRETERRVEPFRLVNTERRWYLVAYDLDRGAWRTFRIDRITEVVRTGHRFVRTEVPDAAALVAEGLAVATYAVQVRLRVLAPPEQVADWIPATVGVLEGDEHGTTVVRLGADDLEWIARYVGGLPFEVEVLEPPELSGLLRAVGERMLRAARRRGSEGTTRREATAGSRRRGSTSAPAP